MSGVLGSHRAGVVPDEGEGLQPRGQFAGQGDEGAPDPVLVEVVQRYLESTRVCP